jgi:O-6-methylguanine DNA methyltransferase
MTKQKEKKAILGATRRIREGWLAVGVTEMGLACLCLPQTTRQGAERIIMQKLAPLQAIFKASPHPIQQYLDPLEGYLQGEVKDFSIPLDLENGSEFDRSVWEGARLIPYGETKSYAWLGAAIGRPGSARAVGGSLGRNPLPIVIPCHRIIKSDGTLGGFGAGLKWKHRLLNLEARFR